MDWDTIILTIFVDLIITVFAYLLVPVIYCLRKKPLTEKQIKKIIIINAIGVWLIFQIIYSAFDGTRTSAAVFLWSWVGYKIMMKNLLIAQNTNDPSTTEEPQEETVTDQISLFEEIKSTPENEKEGDQDTSIHSKGEKVTSIITSKCFAAVISIVLCAVLYLSFLSAFTTERDTYICYTTETGRCFHSATCSYLNTAYETTVYEASKNYLTCNYCNPCVAQYKTTITERNYIIPIFISVPISVAVFFLLTYKKKQ